MARDYDLTFKQAWTGFFLAYDQITKEIDLRMKKAGVVSLDVYDLLVALETAPGGRLKMSELAESISRSMSGVTRSVDKLEKEGLIQRGPCPGDRRVIYVAITEQGLKERKRAWVIYEKGIDELFSGKMSVQEAANMSQIFQRMTTLPGYLRP